MPRLTNSNPKYRRHRASGQAVVTLDGRDFYLGAHGTRTSKAEYDRLIGEWLANGRRLTASPGAALSMVELIAAYWKFAKDYYARDSGNAGDVGGLKIALRQLKALYGPTPAAEFGPLAMKAVRVEMVKAGWSRGYVNQQVGRLRRMFKWATENELIPPAVLHGLQAVPALRKGKTDAPEPDPVTAVAEEHVAQTLPHLSRHVRAMVELQSLSGMRPGEVCGMRTADVDTTGKLWLYAPPKHKTANHGHARTIYLGPRAQGVLRPFLRGELAAYIFSPADAESERQERRHAARTTPLSCGNVPGSKRPKSKRRVGERYTVTAYRQAIARACDAAFPPPPGLARQRVARRRGKGTRLESEGEWRARLGAEKYAELRAWQLAHRWHPHRLRHTAGTRLRKEYGLEAAQVILGHATLQVTQIYAEKNVASAMRIMGEVG